MAEQDRKQEESKRAMKRRKKMEARKEHQVGISIYLHENYQWSIIIRAEKKFMGELN